MKFDIVYHWSPTANKKDILQSGIKLHAKDITYFNDVSKKEEVWSADYICTSLDPWKALQYVMPHMEDNGIEELDLYQITLADTDSIRLRTDGATEIIEVRLLNTIPAGRVRHLGRKGI